MNYSNLLCTATALPFNPFFLHIGSHPCTPSAVAFPSKEIVDIQKFHPISAASGYLKGIY